MSFPFMVRGTLGLPKACPPLDEILATPLGDGETLGPCPAGRWTSSLAPRRLTRRQLAPPRLRRPVRPATRRPEGGREGERGRGGEGQRGEGEGEGERGRERESGREKSVVEK